MRKRALIYLFTVISISSAMAQDNLDDLLKGSIADATILLQGYISPGMKSIGSGLNMGWYNTAKPHGKFGVDLTFTTSLMYIPPSEKFYLVDNTKLEKISLVQYDGIKVDPTTGSANVPTFLGPDKSPSYQIFHEDQSSTIVDGPGGIDIQDVIKIADAMPVPMYQVGFGFPKGFDIKLRFAPTLTFNDFKFNLLGLGLMHNVGQYLPVVKALPVDISLFVGYTKIKAEQGLSGTAAGQNQKGLLEFNSTTFQALVSKKISVLTLYGGVGYDISSSNLAMKGTYDLNDDDIAETTDPVNLDFSTSGARATLGMRLKFAVFTLHGDYTFAHYNALNAGFGINVR